MSDLIFQKAELNDSEILTDISIKAFHTDNLVGGPSEAGPPGYDSIDFHKKMIKVSKSFYKIIFKDIIIGGFWFFDKGGSHYHGGRIFIDPECHQKGIGVESANFIFRTYRHIKKWSLETPPWNVRTISFYKKLGFKTIKKTEHDVFFEKTID